MNRVKLSETKIKNLPDFQWVEYFPYNNAHLLKLDFQPGQLSPEEKQLITPSIRAFQIGEGSDGAHLRKAAARFAAKRNYPKYVEITKWFIIEENRHSQTLKKFMELEQIEPATKLWIDQVFRRLRKWMGIECEVVILVTAEMIALSYYTALAQATQSELLRTICAQMLHDELRHVVLQSDTLHKISQNRSPVLSACVRALRKIVMRATVFVVWRKYKPLFLKGGYPYRTLKQHCLEYLEESIQIEKTGLLP